MEFLANLLGNVATASAITPYTFWFIWDEPECSEELI